MSMSLDCWGKTGYQVKRQKRANSTQSEYKVPARVCCPPFLKPDRSSERPLALSSAPSLTAHSVFRGITSNCRGFSRKVLEVSYTNKDLPAWWAGSKSKAGSKAVCPLEMQVMCAMFVIVEGYRGQTEGKLPPLHVSCSRRLSHPPSSLPPFLKASITPTTLERLN